MKKLIFGLMLTTSACLVADISGTYDVSGWDPYEKEAYTGTVIITKDQNNVYQGNWNLNDGEKYQGTGLIGEKDATFIFVGGDPGQEVLQGVQYYSFEEENLNGAWVLINQNLVGSEKLQKR